MRARVFLASILAICSVAYAAPAQAGVINFGLDIRNDPSRAQSSTAFQTAFYNGSDEGDDLGRWDCGFRCTESDTSLQFALDTSGGAWADKTITSFDFFVDATDVDNGDSFRLELLDGANWRHVGSLASNSGSNTWIPNVNGGRVRTNIPGDVDNTFFLENDATPYNFFDDIANGSLAFRITRLAGNARIDGVNLQVLFDVNPPTRTVPEPTSLLLLGAALLGGATRLRRRS